MAPGQMPYGFNVVSVGYLAGVRMLRRCAEPGCSTLGLGRMCIKHEPKLHGPSYADGRGRLR